MSINWFNSPKDDLGAKTVLPARGAPLTPDECKSLALAIALRGSGFVSPNPPVGCVILSREQRFLGAGFHARVGGLHAEAEALRQIDADGFGADVRGSTAYVTLEPCAHHGRTPPCAELLRDRGVARVVYALKDPNPRVAGAGAELLRAAGGTVECSEQSAEDDWWSSAARELAEVFLYGHESRDGAADSSRVFMGLKVAAAANGVVAREGDRRHWVTGPRARAYGHFLRLRYDSILVGPRTVLADDPALTVRLTEWPARTPMRIILDPLGDVVVHAVARDFQVFAAEPGRTLILVDRVVASTPEARALGQRGVQVVPLATGTDSASRHHFAWADVLATLRMLDLRSVLVEGGPSVQNSAWRSGLVSRLHYFRAPQPVSARAPGDNLLHFEAARNIEALSRQLHHLQRIPLGNDLLIEGIPGANSPSTEETIE